MFRNAFLHLFMTFALSSISYAGQSSLCFGFEPSGSERINPHIPDEETVYVVDLRQPMFTAGTEGRAPGLSDEAILGTPLRVESGKIPAWNASPSFSAQGRIRMGFERFRLQLLPTCMVFGIELITFTIKELSSKLSSQKLWINRVCFLRTLRG